MILRFEFMRNTAARVSVAIVLRGVIPKFDSDPDFRLSYASDLSSFESPIRRRLRFLAHKRRDPKSPFGSSERKSGLTRKSRSDLRFGEAGENRGSNSSSRETRENR